MDNAADIYLYNKLKPITNFVKKLIKINRLTLNEISLS